MNKTSTVIGIIIVLLMIGGIFLYASKNTSLFSGNATTTPTTAVNTTPNNNTNPTSPPKAGVPTVVTSSSVSPSDTTAIVTGSVNPKGAFTAYWYEYGKTPSLGSKTVNQNMGSGFAAVPAPAYITDLSKSTTYYFKLVAENQYGKVSGNQYTFQTTEGTPLPVGSAPAAKTIAASGISSTTVNLNGEVIPNKVATQYWFEYGETADLGNITAFVSIGNGTVKISVSQSLSDLESKTTYYFRLNAQNLFGTVNGPILNLKTK